MLCVSYYAKAGYHQKAVAISNGVPKWFAGRVYRKLAPPWWAVKKSQEGKLSDEEFAKVYWRYLDTLDWDEVLKELPDGAVLLCFEAPYQFCHRHVLTAYLLDRFGMVVPEFGLFDPDRPEPAHITHLRMREIHERTVAEKEAARAAKLAAHEEAGQERPEAKHQPIEQLRFF